MIGRIIKAFLFVAMAGSLSWGSSHPILPHDDAATQKEFENVYQSITNPQISTGIAQNFTIVNASFTNVRFSDGSSLTSSSQTVVQRWYAKVSGTGQTIGTTYLDTGLSATTGVLKSSNDYLAIRFFEPAYAQNAVCRVQLSCNGSVLGTTMGAYANSGTGINGGEAGGVYRYYPGSTAALTCKTQYSAAAVGGVAGIGGDGTTGYDSTMEIEEISQ